MDIGELEVTEDGQLHASVRVHAQKDVDELASMIELRTAQQLWGPKGESHYVRPVSFSGDLGDDFPKTLLAVFVRAAKPTDPRYSIRR